MSTDCPHGLLSHDAIKKLAKRTDEADDGPKLIAPFTDNRCKAARYDISMSSRRKLSPSGVFLANDEGEPIVGPLILHPGDSAWVASFERFCLPPDIAGSVTLRASYANRGLLLLSGSVLDPGYGTAPAGSEHHGSALPDANEGTSARDARTAAGDQRLHFFIANFGSQAIVIRPDHPDDETRDAGSREGDRFATVQFTRMAGPTECDSGPPTPPEAATEGLGFIDSLKELQAGYAQLSESVHRGRDLMRNLILAGYFVLATAVISTSLATILSITTDEKLTAAVYRAVPDSSAGKALLACLAFALAWMVNALVVGLGPHKVESLELKSAALRDRDLAIRQLRAEARYVLALRMTAALAVIALAVWAVVALGLLAGPRWPGWIFLIFLACAGLATTIRYSRKPITDAVVRARLDDWADARDKGTRLAQNVKKQAEAGAMNGRLGDEVSRIQVTVRTISSSPGTNSTNGTPPLDVQGPQPEP